MSSTAMCALCHKHPAIKNSHAIPSFTIKWLKKTSATGYMRQAVQPNRSIQEIQKHELLCVNCEVMFSKFENIFAQKIFVPFQEQGTRSFSYEDWLKRFAVSLAWRTVVTSPPECEEKVSSHQTYINAASECWRKYLLQETADAGPSEHHLLLLGFISEAENVEVPTRTHHYMLRSVDATIVGDEKSVFSYTKLPGMIFWTGVNPEKIPGWNGTQIFERGTVGGSQSVKQPGWGEFFLARVNEISKHNEQISERQLDLIERRMAANPQRTLSSKTIQAVNADEEWEKKQEEKKSL